MDDRFSDFVDMEKQNLMEIGNIKNAFRNFDSEIAKAEARLEKITADMARSKKNKLDGLVEARNKELDALEQWKKKKTEAEKELSKLAVKNAIKNSEEILSMEDSIYAKKVLQEIKINSLKKHYLKEEKDDVKKRLKEEIDSENKKLELLLKEESILKKTADYKKKIESIDKKSNKLKEFGDKKAEKELEKEKKKLELEQRKESLQERLESDDITKEEYVKEKTAISREETKLELAEEFKKFRSQMLSSFSNAITDTIKDVNAHRTKIMARLQGVGGDEYDYASLMNTVSRNLAVSPYITQKAFMEKLDNAVDRGIAYNVEQRAFLSTIAEEIATTFDAFDSNLLRLIKLQQSDSTAARLGMEAELTKTLNKVFQDSSYLTDEVYKGVRGALIDSESLMGRGEATEFEYVVQKWLGALYSLGASNDLINQIAQGLNYIGTGNVQALASNSPLQTLFAMSASRATGVDYADLLVGGLTTEKTNELLKSMVEYLREIAIDNKKNNVVQAAYGNLYNMSLSDMKAITSLTEGDISSIYTQSMSYDNMNKALTNQFSSLSKRLSVSQMTQNLIDNFTYTIGSDIAQSAVSQILWEVADFIGKTTDGLHLPAISVFGNMIDLSSFTVEGILKTGLVGYSTLSQMGNILSALKTGGFDLGGNVWGYSDTMKRGQIEEFTSGAINTTSGSTYIGSGSSGDIKKSSIAGAVDESSDVEEITSTGNEDDYTIDDWYRAVLKDRTPVPIEISPLTNLGAALEKLSAFLLTANRVTDVNIKKAEISVPTTLDKLDTKFKDEIKNYIKSVYIEMLSSELKDTLIGPTKGMGGATIAKVCDKIMNDKVDVQVKNDGIDTFLSNSYALHF